MSTANDNPRELLHNSHEHGLVMRELSENCSTFECFICLSSVKGGLAYRCPDCDDFFLHKYCAELPSAIQKHPFHPQHQLELKFRKNQDAKDGEYCSGCFLSIFHGDRHLYGCDECRIILDVGCAAATLPSRRKYNEHENEEEETTQHIAHEHPLQSFYVNSPCSSSYCTACREDLFGLIYGCRACMFLLHESCALAPQEIESHPLHPQHPLTLIVDFKNNTNCRACRYYSKRFVYYCNECHFNLCLGCATSVENHHISIPQEDHNSEKDRQEIQHYSHPHPLTYCHAKKAKDLGCDFCYEVITGDFYVCPDCLFMLHKSCAKLPQDMAHPLHPDHLLTCQTSSSDCSLCPNADKFLFKCQECDFGLHPRCALQTLSASENELVINIKHFHEYPMRLRTWSFKSFCDICQGTIPGLCYESEVANIHKTCAELPQQSEFSVHPQHPLFLLSELPDESEPCAACHESCSGVTLHCHTCKIQFHVHCVLNQPTLKYQRHEHTLTYFELIDSGRKHNVLCNVCGDECRIDLYRCIPCNYNLHYDCSRLPPSVKHEWHIHKMVLRDKYINEDFDMDEQYCDLCETLRHPEHGVYYCVECRCATHIDCVIPKLDLDKKRRIDEVELRKLDERIFSLEAKTETSGKELESVRKEFEMLTKELEECKEKRLLMLSSMTTMRSEDESSRT